MSDLFEGQTMTEAFDFVSGGAAYDLSLNFPPDMIQLRNLTDWTSTAGGLPDNFWFRNLTTAAYAFQTQVIDTNAGASFNYIALTTNGFTDASTSAGVDTKQCLITAITAADPGALTHAAFTFQNDQLVRITDLGPDMPTARGMDELNNKRYRVVVIDATHISLKDPISGEAIDTTSFVTYVEGGRLTLETTVQALNHPQVSPYDVTPYVPNPFAYDPAANIMTLGTSVIGGDGDIILVTSTKFGQWTRLGDIGA